MRAVPIAVGLLQCVLTLVTGAWRHPLHTTITTITYDAHAHAAKATIRIFVDDLLKAVHERGARTATRRDAGLTALDSTGLAYVQEMFAIAEDDGRPAVLAPCGQWRTADVQWVCLRATLPHGLAGARIRNAVLTDLYADQVNVVMADYADRHTTLLFTRGDKAKALPGENGA